MDVTMNERAGPLLVFLSAELMNKQSPIKVQPADLQSRLHSTYSWN